jgi:hypothetical protein
MYGRFLARQKRPYRAMRQLFPSASGRILPGLEKRMDRRCDTERAGLARPQRLSASRNKRSSRAKRGICTYAVSADPRFARDDSIQAIPRVPPFPRFPRTSRRSRRFRDDPPYRKAAANAREHSSAVSVRESHTTPVFEYFCCHRTCTLLLLKQTLRRGDIARTTTRIPSPQLRTTASDPPGPASADRSSRSRGCSPGSRAAR